MKRTLVLSLILQLDFFNAQVVIQQPELNILYRGYDNLLIPEAEGAEENKISAVGAVVTPTKFKGRNGFLVRPQGTKVVSIVHEAKINGEWKNFDTTFYNVKPFPKPQVYNNSVSKTSGAKFQVGLGSNCPIRIEYEVTKIEINDHTINGNEVSPEIIKNLKVGKMVGIELTAINSQTNETIQIIGVVEITN